MAEIRVELRDFTESILGNLDITSSDDFPLSLNYQNFDVRDFNSRNGSFSKTFKVPATRNNNRLFNHIYKDGHALVKDAIKQIPSTIYSDNIPIIVGKLRVTQMIKDTSIQEYECIFLGDNMDWANSIKNKELKELTFSDSQGYTFENPHGFDGNSPNQNAHSYQDFSSTIDKLVYPLLSVGEGDSIKNQVVESDFVPCVYVKNVWDKIFQAQGYSVTSTFCDSDFFKSLVMPLIFEKNAEVFNDKFGKIYRNTDENLTDEVAGNSFSDGDGTVTLNRAVGNPSVNIDGDPVSYDHDGDGSQNDGNTTGGVFYVFGGDEFTDDAPSDGAFNNVADGNSGLKSLLVKNAEGESNLDFDVSVNVFNNSSFSAGSDPNMDIYVQAYISKISDTDDDDLSQLRDSDNIVYESSLRYITIHKNDSPASIDLGSFSESLTVDDAVGTKYVFYVRFYLQDYAGETFSVFGGDDNGDVGIKYKLGSYIEISDSDEIEIGTQIPRINTLLPNAKQSEFVSGIAQMFNLQFETDSIAKQIKIEPYDHFYGSFTNAIDWTDKIDYSKNITEEFLYDIKSKIVLKYKDASNDAFLERYNKKNFIDWGSYEEVDESERFLEGEYVIENKYFSPTFNYHEIKYIDETTLNLATGVAATEDNYNAASAILAPLIPIYHKEFSDLSTKEDRGEKDFDIGARILLLPPANGANIQYDSDITIMFGSEFALPTSYSYAPLPNNDMDAESNNNPRFTRGNFINIDNFIWNGSTLEFAQLNNGYENVDLNLSFADVKYDVPEAYVTGGLKTIKGLYHHYYEKMFKQLKQKPRIKKIYLNLKDKDVSSLDFKKLIFLDGNYYRLNKIVDYKPHIKDSTKVELTEYFKLGGDVETVGGTMNMVNGIDL